MCCHLTINTLEQSFWGVPPYTFFVLVGLFSALSVYVFLLAKRGVVRVIPQMIHILLSFPFLFLGAKLVAIIGKVIYLVSTNNPLEWDSVYSAGIAYYGGLFGLLLGFYLWGKLKKLRCETAIEALSVCIPLFHFFGRLGCFFAGCCYGKESDVFYFTYTNLIDGATVTANRIPIQLIESMLNFILFFILIILYYRGKEHLIKYYLCSYACIRFFTEFFRADGIRGVLGWFSISQYISLTIVIITFVFYFKKRRREKNGESI